MELLECTIIDAPISTRFWYNGTKGHYDKINKQVRVGGVWFNWDEQWKFLETLPTGD